MALVKMEKKYRLKAFKRGHKAFILCDDDIIKILHEVDRLHREGWVSATILIKTPR